MQEYLLFKGLVLRCLCYFESIFVCLFLIEPDMTFCRYCLLTFAPTTTLKSFNPTKDIRKVSYQISINELLQKLNYVLST